MLIYDVFCDLQIFQSVLKRYLQAFEIFTSFKYTV